MKWMCGCVCGWWKCLLVRYKYFLPTWYRLLALYGSNSLSIRWCLLISLFHVPNGSMKHETSARCRASRIVKQSTPVWYTSYFYHGSILSHISYHIIDHLASSGLNPDHSPSVTDTNHSGHGLRQWETTLQSNVVSHWLSPYTEWSLFMGSGNERQRYKVTSSLIGWAHTQKVLRSWVQAMRDDVTK